MALLSQALHLGYLLSPHSAFQGHAAHTARWPAMLSPNGSSDTCISDGVFHIPMPYFHGALPVCPRSFDIPPYCFHGAAAHLRRILLMEQQVWSLQRARRSTVRPRVAADNQPCDLVSQCFLLTVPFRGMLLTPQDGLQCLAPTAHQIPVYLMVFSTFLCRAFTAHHPQHIALASLSQLPAQPRVPTQLIVSRHPAMGHFLTPRVEHFQALLLPCVIPYLRRHMALLASWLVSCPLLRQGQAEVEHGVVVAGDVAHEHTHLAVVDLPPMATPLAFHPHRVHAAFGETAGIKRDHASGFPQPLDHVGDQDLDQRAVIPGGGTEEIWENLSLDIDERRDVLGILPGQVGQEPLEG